MRKLTVRIPDAAYDQIQTIRRAVREEGHKPPTIDTLIGALIVMAAESSWDTFEQDVLVPYRQRYPEVA